LNDYEGISKYERYRPDLALMYFATLESSTGALTQVRLARMQIRRFRLNHASRDDAVWLRDARNRASTNFNVQVELAEDGMLIVRWD
jgi:poly-gamma-glutamate synthesis protein (capsule biosynthesis protein)